MPLDQHQIDLIRVQFGSMQTKEDLLALLNFAKSLVFHGSKQKPIKLRSLTWYANTSLNVVRYSTFKIPKTRGGERIIFAPASPLKTIQRSLNLVLHCLFTPHKAATGFVRGKSITDNARPHIGKEYVYNLDLKDFFTSIDFHRVKACLKLPPFNLDNEREPLAFLIANLCCVRHPDDPTRAFLPQGAPTSPILTNVVCQQLDQRLSGLAKRFGATYTRYADDLTFSSFKNIYQSDKQFCLELEHIITGQKFVINPAKTRLQQPGYRQEVTGIIVNERVNVPRQFWRNVRALLHNWESLGYNEANSRFLKISGLGKAYTGNRLHALANVLSGKLMFMKMVRGSDDALFQRYEALYNKLASKLPGTPAKTANERLLTTQVASTAVEQQVAMLMDEAIRLYKSNDISGATVALARLSDLMQTKAEGKNQDNESKLYSKPHKPKDVADFMKLFDDASGLKYLTHDYDEVDKPFNIRTFLKKSNAVFASSASKHDIPRSLYTLINQFAFQQNPSWFTQRNIKEGWSTQKWIKWSERNGHPSRNPEFDKIIQEFRQWTRVQGSLSKIIETSIEKKFKDARDHFNFEFSESELGKADFYTHVGNLILALGHIFDGICHSKNKSNVKINYERQTVGDYRHRIIRICHCNSFPINSRDEVFEKYKQQGGNFWSVRKILFGYCDWYIETKWDGQPVRVHLLREGMMYDKVEVKDEELDTTDIPGFTHTLIFYHR